MKTHKIAAGTLGVAALLVATAGGTASYTSQHEVKSQECVDARSAVDTGVASADAYGAKASALAESAGFTYGDQAWQESIDLQRHSVIEMIAVQERVIADVRCFSDDEVLDPEAALSALRNRQTQLETLQRRDA